ncbi:hypothetical protein ES677_01300 [Bizionia gelidisalsuginis]|uniref:Insecticide toxin TcdB middle/N-terminal domain-containing protein n=1 Tax=Bizionia gelidisalsuginis TaxID=291188 RepID=A0ABY3MEM4_9FLAO|nr:SpvB/TcaC N-terminal domain-containing protein [Bizionia gelidisalsuginis]TYC18042.1 hypothetical protein ES677_01300 [Bizionia gelidisalsuginis]
MPTNHFQTIKKSYFTATLLTSLLSNIIVFGQPIQQISQSVNRLEVIKLSNYGYTDNYNSSLSEKTYKEPFTTSDNIDTTSYKTKRTKSKEKTLVNKNNTTVFYALEEQAIIGISSNGRENPKDNFFTISLPDTLNINNYDVVLTYNVFGVEGAQHTTKSINNSPVYGGQAVKLNKDWTLVEEYIPAQYLKNGKNEIFFNRRADKNYLYKVKNLSIKFVKKRIGTFFLTQKRLTNFNGKLHLLGYVTNNINEIEVLGKMIAVKNGVFEYVFDTVPNNFKTLKINYGKYNQLQEEFTLDYSQESINLVLSNTLANQITSVNNDAMQNTLTLDALTLEDVSKVSKLTENMLGIEGLRFEELRPLNSDVSNVTSGKFLGYRVKTIKKKESSSFKVYLKYDETKIPDGYSGKDVRTFSFDKKKREWIALPVDSLDYESKTIISNYNGDTDYINGVIKVPEMAETSSFVPTTISDMKYADPSAGIVSISPPSPNPNGIASTSFPIKLPTGRNGMMPSLSVNYNSEASNGWMGVGWNLQLPSITLDTRWGTPRFDSVNESEIYQLNGETLVQKVNGDYTNPHRYPSDIFRNQNESKIFYLRKEGSFYKIVRLGTTTQDYKWEVTDKYGNKSFYGTTTNTVIRDATLSSGNITHWALYKTQDPYGNYVIYQYDKGMANTQETNGVTAQYFYPKTIKYTLKGSSNPNYYQIDFLRKNYTLGSSAIINRTDVALSARNGVMMAEHELLTEIKIKYYDGLSKPIRSYRFDYIESAFKKMQLSKISEYDAAGNHFYSNTMEYYDEVGNGQLINTGSVNWNGSSDNLGSPLLDLAPGGTAIPNGSALGTGTTSGDSYGLRFGIGLGTGVTSVRNTLGGSNNYSQAKEKTRISFLDINGDGLPDKVYKPDSGGLKYLPNLGVINGQGSFGSSLPVGWNNLDETKSKTNTKGIDANLFGLVGAGRNWNKTRTETDGYFTDFNGDGLPDIITGGSVRFNRTSPWSTPTSISFNANVNTTENPITSGAINTALINNLDLETKEELREEHSQFDHVKVWTAPYTGTINIQGVAKLIAKNNCGNSSEPNQFKLTIERASNGQNTGTTNQISSSFLSNVNQTKSYNISQSVIKGDLLFFRMHNEVYGCGGELDWNPIVTYTPLINIPNTTNEQSKHYSVFKAHEDYMMNNGGSWSPDKEDNSISINWNLPSFTQYQFSDNITFKIEKVRRRHITSGTNEGEVDQELSWVWSKTYNHQNGSTAFTSLPSNFYSTSNQFVNNGLYSYEYRLYVESDSNVQWDLINWQPIITGGSSGQHYAPVSYIAYDSNVNQSNYQIYGNSFPNPNIDPTIPNDENNPLLQINHNMFDVDYSQFITNIEDVQFPVKINWVVKEEISSISRVLHKRTFYLHKIDCFDPPLQPDFCTYKFRVSSTPTSSEIVPSNSFYKPYFQYDITKEKVQELKNSSGKLYASFYLEHPEFGQNNSAEISISLHPNVTNNSFTTKILNKPFFSKSPTFYGWTYRGWGQFLYNGGLKFQYDNEGNIIYNTPSTLFDGAIDMSVFDYNANLDDLQNDIDNADPSNMDLNDTTIRYTFYTQDNETNSYKNIAIKNNADIPVKFGFNNSNQLTTLLGRFAEHNIYDLWTDPATLINGSAFAGLKQRSISKGKSTSGNVGIGSVGASGTKSEASSKILNQYLDLNGDRYPDIVTNGNIQFTSMRGGLSSEIIVNNFVSGAKSKDETVGVTVSGAAPNSTASDNMNTTNATKTNVNSGINTSNGNSYDSKQWSDINGDGLTDKITIYKTEIRVQLNTGYGFGNEVVWGSGYNDLYVSTRNNIGVGGGISGSSWAAGFGAAESNAKLNAALIDVNADGLPDLVEEAGSNYKFYLNNGTSFESTAIQTFHNASIDKSTSFTGNIYGTGTYGFFISLWILTIKFTFTPTAGVNAGVNEKRITVQDINGDGLPDVLQKGSDNGDVIAKLNKVGKTNLLKTVNTPLGGSWTINYNREGNTYNMPHNKWVLKEIATDDNFIADSNFAPNISKAGISYENPKYDRRDREFLGFGEVRVDQKDVLNNDATYRYSVTEYHNENIYLKGLAKRTATYKGDGEVLTESTTLYNIMDPDQPIINLNASEANNYLQGNVNVSDLDKSRLFVAPVKTVSTTYEEGIGLSVEQHFSEYDSIGNLLIYKNLGNQYANGVNTAAYYTELEYASDSEFTNLDNCTGLVKSIRVYDQITSQLLREREAVYNNKGKLNTIKTKLNINDTNTVVLNYDSYGNVEKTILQGGFETNITYDTALHTYPIQVKNPFNEIATSSYNYLFGVPTLITDANAKKMRSRYDNRGRLVEVTAPNEMPNGWTIKMQYENETSNPTFNGNGYAIAQGSFSPSDLPLGESKHHAITRNYTQGAFNTELLTVSLVDGLGKAIQLKKALYTNPNNGAGQLKWLISGKEQKDAFGRTTAAYLPTVQSSLYPNNPEDYIDDFYNSIGPITMDYDIKDRITTTTQPGGMTSTMDYSITDGMLITLNTNYNGQSTQTFENHTDVLGRQRKTVQNGDLTTKFYFNTVGEKIKVKNHQGYETFYKYDLAGRRLEERHPDRGVTTFKYDVLSNLVERSTSNILANGGQQAISYQYNFNRLTAINYPFNEENNVTYTYGAYGDQDAQALNTVGRLYMQKDASGVQGFGYDNLGNLNNHLRGVAVAGRHTFWFYTQWVYDSNNRIKQITYPDNETLRYNYNSGGSLQNVERSIPGVPNASSHIISEIKYNDLGERTQITYGNGTKTFYEYDNRRRLEDLKHQFNGVELNNQYTYDGLSNITGISTENSTLNPGQLGGPVSHTYKYDKYNRLVTASGRYTGPNDLSPSFLAQEYTLEMKYDLAHNITQKKQTHIQGVVTGYGEPINNPETMVKTNYHLEYEEYATGVNITPTQDGEFGYVQPHAPRSIIETPSENGIPATDPSYKKKIIEYDANGNQELIKQVVVENTGQIPAYEGVVEQIETILRKNVWDEENRLRAVDLNPEDKSAHPLSVYTYDASGQRVVRYVPSRADVRSNANNVSKNEIDEVMLYPSALVTAKALSKPGVVPNRGDLVSNYTKHYYVGSQRISSTLGTMKDLGLYPIMRSSWFQSIRDSANASVLSAYSGLYDSYTQLEQGGNFNTPNSGGQEGDLAKPYVHIPEKYDAYWYHSDHLGSSSYITNTNGVVSQHIEYMPFGETLVDEHQNSYNSPFKFNGKELDEETGNYYYGARYYDPKWSVWLSVDPLAESMPSWSPYNYTFNNPVRFTDPTGMAPEMPLDDYGIDKNGKITFLRATNDTTDKLISLDSNGAETDTSIEVDKGVLNKKYSQNGKDSDGNWFSYDILKVRGDSKASSLFEFAADNTDVEWSQTQLGEAGKKGLNYLTTSHDKATEKGVAQMINTQFHNGYTIRGHIHNHPGNTPYPSGLNDGTGDTGFATSVTNWYNNKYPGRTTPNYKIYTSGNGSYINYNKNSTMTDFITIQLPEVIIKN